jgi:hypothetical protein
MRAATASRRSTRPQVATLNEVFKPTAEELERAGALVAALNEAAREKGRGAIVLDGEMLDETLRVAALRTLSHPGGNEPVSDPWDPRAAPRAVLRGT